MPALSPPSKPTGRDYIIHRRPQPQQSPAQRQKACDDWNAMFPVGTKVKVYRVAYDESTAFETTTRTQAQLCAANYPVIWVDGQPGYYVLAFVKPIA